MTRIFITGDTHGEIDIHKLNKKNFPIGQTLTKDDYVIICGDFGFVWGNSQANVDKWWQKWLSDQPWTTLFIDGNHENHDLLNSYPVEKWHGGRIHKINDSIIHLMRGEIYDIGGLTFFSFGGGFSIDRMYRKEGLSWWKGELPTHQEVEKTIKNLEKHHNQVDIILTHDAPKELVDYLGYFKKMSLESYGEEYEDINSVLQFFKNTINFKQWYLGHYHIDKDILNYHVLYDRIIEVDKEDFNCLKGQ